MLLQQSDREVCSP